MLPVPSPTTSASVPNSPSSASRSTLVTRPTAYIVVPMMNAPGSAIVRKPFAPILVDAALLSFGCLQHVGGALVERTNRERADDEAAGRARRRAR